MAGVREVNKTQKATREEPRYPFNVVEMHDTQGSTPAFRQLYAIPALSMSYIR